MAKGKQSKGRHYTSKGSVGVDRKLSNQIRRGRTEAENMLNMFKAYESGKNAYVTIDNPNPKETNKRRIRVSARDIYGDPKVWRLGERKPA